MADTDRAARYAAAWRSARQRATQEREFADQDRELTMRTEQDLRRALARYFSEVRTGASPSPDDLLAYVTEAGVDLSGDIADYRADADDEHYERELRVARARQALVDFGLRLTSDWAVRRGDDELIDMANALLRINGEKGI